MARSIKPKARRLSKAEVAGERYATDQIQGDYFMDWAREQLLEASRMSPEDVLPLETKADAMVIAKNMFQQLEWDAKRDGAAHEQLGNDASREDAGEFYKGFRHMLDISRDWLADELLEINQQTRGRSRSSLNERPRTSGHRRHRVSGSGFRAPPNPKNPGWYLRYSDGEVQGPHPGGEQAAKQAARSLSSSFPGMPVTAFQVEAKRSHSLSGIYTSEASRGSRQEITYIYMGDIERGRSNRRGRPGYEWKEGWSENGNTQPWLTKREAQAEARNRGAVAKFVRNR